ncbi:MAG: YerC/YecD family TrpR-related protein [Bacilli bacterium]
MSFHSKFKSEEMDELFEAILSLENIDECYRLFEDLCTINELHSICQRLQVAKMLNQKRTYIEIEKETKASTATISRVNKSLTYGADGYKLIFERI